MQGCHRGDIIIHSVWSVRSFLRIRFEELHSDICIMLKLQIIILFSFWTFIFIYTVVGLQYQCYDPTSLDLINPMPKPTGVVSKIHHIKFASASNRHVLSYPFPPCSASLDLFVLTMALLDIFLHSLLYSNDVNLRCIPKLGELKAWMKIEIHSIYFISPIGLLMQPWY